MVLNVSQSCYEHYGETPPTTMWHDSKSYSGWDEVDVGQFRNSGDIRLSFGIARPRDAIFGYAHFSLFTLGEIGRNEYLSHALSKKLIKEDKNNSTQCEKVVACDLISNMCTSLTFILNEVAFYRTQRIVVVAHSCS